MNLFFHGCIVVTFTSSVAMPYKGNIKAYIFGLIHPRIAIVQGCSYATLSPRREWKQRWTSLREGDNEVNYS